MTTRTYLTPAKAGRAADVTARCILLWIRKYPGLGRKVGGRWRVDPDAFGRLLHGEAPGGRPQ